jgi:hypothetical protein
MRADMQRQTVTRTWQERLLCVLLRWVGGVSLLALVPIFMPHRWMDGIHRALGMGTLPAIPVVGYLTRSLSFFYALMGALLVFFSFDIAKYREALFFLGGAFIFFGMVMLGIDYSVGMPNLWKQIEGPYIIAFGVALLALLPRTSRRD